MVSQVRRGFLAEEGGRWGLDGPKELNANWRELQGGEWMDALRGGGNLDSIHWVRNTGSQEESCMRTQERRARHTTKELFLTFIHEIVLLTWEGGA